jgi:hypothetical protein
VCSCTSMTSRLESNGGIFCPMSNRSLIRFYEIMYGCNDCNGSCSNRSLIPSELTDKRGPIRRSHAATR